MNIGYKLFRLRKNDTLGPLFINARLVVTPDVWYEAEDHPTKGYAHRPGWHLALTPFAPHLTTKGRVWCRVEYDDATYHARPMIQGGSWILARRIRVIDRLTPDQVHHFPFSTKPQ